VFPGEGKKKVPSVSCFSVDREERGGVEQGGKRGERYNACIESSKRTGGGVTKVFHGEGGSGQGGKKLILEADHSQG